MFKSDLDIWKNKPEIIAVEEIQQDTKGANNSSIYELPIKDQILHIISTETPTVVKFSMYDVSQNIRRVGLYLFKTRKLEAGTRAALVKDLRSTKFQETETFYVLTDNILEKTLLKFTFDRDKSLWREPIATVACMIEGKVTNSFLLDDEVLIICTL